MTPLDILFLSHSPDNPNGGASRIYHLLTAALRERGHRVDLHHLDSFGLPQGRLPRLLAQRLAMPRYLSRFGARLDLEQYDIVMSSSGMAAPLFRALAGRTRRPALVNHIHGLFLFDHLANVTEHRIGNWPTSPAYRLATGPLQVRWDLAGIRAADLNIVQNMRDLGWVRPRLPERREASLIPAAVHPQILAASDVRGVSRDPDRILWFGTWESRKGAYYVPGAFRQIRASWPAARLVIGGSSKPADELRAHFDPEDRDHVEILPRLSIDEQASQYARASIFLFPSLSEGFGLALAEALCFGLAAVTSSTGFGGDHLRDGKTARVVHPSTEHIAAAVLDLLRSPAERERIGAAGSNLAHGFTPARMTDAYEAAFAEAHGNRAARSG